MVRPLEESDLSVCSQLYVEAYNDKRWGCHWQPALAERYLKELSSYPRFVGFAICEEGQLRGALFCHERTSWDADEVYIDDLFIGPQYQQMGYGHELLKALEGYIQKKHLAGATLMTVVPACHFYLENGYKKTDKIRFMYKVIN